MAKLNVVIPAADVEVIGEDGVKTKYRKVDRYANEGDIIRITDNDDSSYVVEGAFYTVEYLDGADDPQILDEDGDEYDAGHMEYEVYEEVTETHASASDEITFGGTKYRRVDRSAEEGDVIEITELADEDDAITVGGLYRVESLDWAGDPQITDDDGDDFDTVGTSYEVYERQPKFLSAGAYVKVVREGGAHNYEVGSVVKITDGYKGGSLFNAERSDRSVGNLLADDQVEPATEAEFLAQKAFKVGDYVKVTDACGAEGVAKVGDIGEVTNENWSGGPVGDRTIIDIKTLDGREYGMYAHRFVRAKEAEIESAREAAKQALKYGDFMDGDYAQIVNATEDNANTVAIEYAGSFVRVTRDIDGYRGLALRLPSGIFAGYANADALRKVTREEYEAAVDPRNKFAKGDKVRLISGGQGSGLFGFNTGEIYEVTDPKTSDWESKRIQIGNRFNLGFALPDQLEKVSAEEFAEIERKQAEESKWRAIGRKVGEFKRGDIVKVIRVPNGVTNGHKEGAIGEVVSDTTVVNEGRGNPQIKVSGVSSQYCNNAVIIVPVERRFDREQVETAQAA